jgi:hypothetical protein
VVGSERYRMQGNPGRAAHAGTGLQSLVVNRSSAKTGHSSAAEDRFLVSLQAFPEDPHTDRHND